MFKKTRRFLAGQGIPVQYLQQVMEQSLEAKAGLRELYNLGDEGKISLPVTQEEHEFHALNPWVAPLFDKIPGWVPQAVPAAVGSIIILNAKINRSGWREGTRCDIIQAYPQDGYEWKIRNKESGETRYICHNEYTVETTGIEFTSGMLMPEGAKQSVKITRWLAKQMPTMDQAIIDEFVKRLKVKNPAAIVPQFGELVSLKKDSMVTLSTTLFDFFTSSAGGKYSSYTSCYSTSGCHFNGNIAYLLDDITLLAYKSSIARPDYKEGRSWIYSNGPYIIQPKSYGTFTNRERSIIRGYMEPLLAAKHGIPAGGYDSMHHARGLDNVKSRGVVYLDNYAFDISYPKSLHSSPDNLASNGLTTPLEFGEAICLRCGDETNYTSAGCCICCAEKAREYCCSECEEIISSGREHSVGDEYFCRDCFNEIFWECQECHIKVRRDTGEEGVHVDNGKCVCHGCSTSRYTYCDGCGVHHRSTDTTFVTVENIDATWCKAHADLMSVHECADCRKHFASGIHEIVKERGKSGWVCDGCITNYQHCPDCGKYCTELETVGKHSMCLPCSVNYDVCGDCSETFHIKDLLLYGAKVTCSGCLTDTIRVSDKQQATYHKEFLTFHETRVQVVEHKRRVKLDADREAGLIPYFEVGDTVRIVADSSVHTFDSGSTVTVAEVITQGGKFFYHCSGSGKTRFVVIADMDLRVAAPVAKPKVARKKMPTISATVQGFSADLVVADEYGIQLAASIL